MANVGSTIEYVARPKKDKGGSKGSDSKPRPGYPIFARVKDELGVVLDKYLEDQRPKPTVTAVIETALEDFLRSRGYDVPSAPKKNGGDGK